MRIELTLTSHHAGSVRTGDAVRVVAVGRQPATLSGECQPIGASLENRLVICWVTLIIVITILFMGENGVALALARSAKVYCSLGGGALGRN